jgi:hypothetical protein
MDPEKIYFWKKYIQRSYNLQTIVLCLKEFTAVMVQLVCYSRLGMVDLFNGGLLLFMILIVFAFPFLNSYLFGFMRFGMWWVYIDATGHKNEDENTIPSDGNETDTRYTRGNTIPSPLHTKGIKKLTQKSWFFRTFSQFIFVSLFQSMGAIAAANIVKAWQSRWLDATLSLKSYNNSDKIPQPIELTYNQATLHEHDMGWIVAEEVAAVFLLLVGMLHLMHFHSEPLLHNAYWRSQEPNATEEKVNPSNGFKSDREIIESKLNEIKYSNGEIESACRTILRRTKQLLRPLPPVVVPIGKSQKQPLQPLQPESMFPTTHMTLESDQPNTVYSTEQSEDSQEKPRWKPSPSNELPTIPANLIFHASLLVAAISRAFPSAHQSLHLSVYIWAMGDWKQTDHFFARIGGGYVATGFALTYYWFWYVIAGSIHGDADPDTGKKKSWARRNFLDVQPAIFRGKLRLPDYMQI